MKTNTIKTLALLLFLLSSFLGYKLYQKNQQSESCKYGKERRINAPSNRDLTFNLKTDENKNFQPIQYDILNSYGILAHVESYTDSIQTINKINFDLLDIAECDRFYIERVIYNPNYSDPLLMGRNKELIFIINKYDENDDGKEDYLEVLKFDPNNDIFKVTVLSRNDKRITGADLIKSDIDFTKLNINNSNFNQTYFNKFLDEHNNIYGEFDCPLKIK